MKAVVLAGGKGTRLRPLTYTTPKPLVPVVNRPILDRILQALFQAGVDEAIVTTNYQAKKIERFLRGQHYPVPVRVVEEKKALGTAGAVKNAAPHLDDAFLVVQGDGLHTLDLKGFMAFKGRPACIAVKPVENPSAFGIVELGAGQRIKRFLEKPRPEECFSNLANTGLYKLEPQILEEIPDDRPFDFSIDLFPRLLKKKVPLYGFPTTGDWMDIGRIQPYLEGNRWLLKKENAAHLGERAVVSEQAKLVPPYHLADNVLVKPGATVGPYAVLGPACIVGRNASVSRSVVFQETVIGENARLEGCVIADACEIQENACIGENAVLGQGTLVGPGSKVMAGSRIGPLLKLPKKSTIDGLLSPNLGLVYKTQAMLEKLPSFRHLQREELRVLILLAEFGELRKDAIAHLRRASEVNIDKVIQRLQQKGYITLNQDLFSLLYEDPTRLNRFLQRARNRFKR